MAFSMREFLKSGFLNAIGKQPAYLIIQQAAAWHKKGALLESDLAEINDALAEAGALDAGALES